MKTRPKWPDIIFVAGFALLTAAYIIPIWIVRIVPQQDIWQHLALVDVIHNFWAPGSAYPDYYILPDTPKPNLFYYYFTHLLAFVTPSLEIANKLVLTLYVITFPVSFLYFLRSFGRSRWLSYFSFPFVYNAMFYFGFVSFTIGLPMLFAGTGLFRRFLQKDSGIDSVPTGAASAGLLTLMYFTHAHTFLLACLMWGVLLLLHVRNVRTRPWEAVERLWPFAPAMVFFIPWFVVYFIENTPSSSGMHFGSFDNFFGSRYHSSSQVLSNFFNYISNYFRRQSDDTVFLTTFLLLMVLLMMRRAPKVPRDSARKLKYFDLEILTLLLAASVVVLPHHIQAQSVVSLRHILPAFMLFIGWAGFSEAPRRIAYPTVLLVAVVSFANVGVISEEFRRFERELDDYPALFDNVAGGRTILKVSATQDSRVINVGAFWHVHHLYAILKGGISDTGFAEYPHNPIQYKPGMTPPQISRDVASDPAWRYYDYVLARREPAVDLSGIEDSLELISQNDGWSVFRVVDGPLHRESDSEPIANPRRKSSNVVSEQHSGMTGKPKPGGDGVNAVIETLFGPSGGGGVDILPDDVVRQRLRNPGALRRQRSDN